MAASPFHVRVCASTPDCMEDVKRCKTHGIQGQGNKAGERASAHIAWKAWSITGCAHSPCSCSRSAHTICTYTPSLQVRNEPAAMQRMPHHPSGTVLCQPPSCAPCLLPGSALGLEFPTAPTY